LKYTERAVNVFLNTGTKFPRRIIWAMGIIKYAAAKANSSLGLLDERLGEAIAKASLELANGLHDDKVVVDVYQTGSGTGLNMNVNEVIAWRASELCGCEVHPNDHVNMCQSTNDVVTSAIRIAAIVEVRDNLIPSLRGLINVLDELALKYSDVVKPGRTHLRDALPVTLGLELGAYSSAFKYDLTLIHNALDYIMDIPLGGTAVGTGINAHPEYPRLVLSILRDLTGINLTVSKCMSRGMRSLSDLVALSGGLRVLALDMLRLCQDLRLMYSGPNTGLNEVDIPQEVPGSSIMPGKENPVTVEAAMLAAVQVVGLDHSNTLANTLGEFELSMGIPLIGYNIITQITLLSEAIRKLGEKVLKNLSPNIERMQRLAMNSRALITILTPLIGYDKAAELAVELSKGKDLMALLKELGFDDATISEVLDLNKLVKPGFPIRKAGK